MNKFDGINWMELIIWFYIKNQFGKKKTFENLLRQS